MTLIKIASNVLVVILNYVASKLIIFRKKDKQEIQRSETIMGHFICKGF